MTCEIFVFSFFVLSGNVHRCNLKNQKEQSQKISFKKSGKSLQVYFLGNSCASVTTCWLLFCRTLFLFKYSVCTIVFVF